MLIIRPELILTRDKASSAFRHEMVMKAHPRRLLAVCFALKISAGIKSGPLEKKPARPLHKHLVKSPKYLSGNSPKIV